MENLFVNPIYEEVKRCNLFLTLFLILMSTMNAMLRQILSPRNVFNLRWEGEYCQNQRMTKSLTNPFSENIFVFIFYLLVTFL